MAAQDTIKALRARCAELEGEVIRLKKELAKRGAAHGRNTTDVGPVGVGACGHGQFCQALTCRAARA